MRDPSPRQAESRETVLVLVDEIQADGLPDHCRRLVEALAARVDPVLVAQIYLKPSHRARKLPFRHAFYGFPPDDYRARVKHFAAEVVGREAPAWALAYGCENTELIAALDRLDIPVLLFVDRLHPAAEGQLTRTFLCAEAILFADASIPQALDTARWSLDARNYDVLDAPSDLPTTPARRGGWRGLFGRSPPTTDVTPIAVRLVEIGKRAWAQARGAAVQRRRDAAAIETSGLFNAELFLPRHVAGDGDAADAIGDYLRVSRHAVPRDRLFAGRWLRRPAEGFNPLIYASDHPGFDEASGEEPFAHYLRLGRPPGRWVHPIIRHRPEVESTPMVRVALHAHMHYPDLLPELLERLRANQTAPDLFISTTSETRRTEIAAGLAATGVTATVLTTYAGNRGRDIWPFLDLLGSRAFAAYDVVGHVHGKRSPTYALGDVWRDFLWRHLIGRPERMMDAVVARFAADEDLGLVMPEDPYLEGWEEDLAIATELARKMGVALPLPTHFEYPMGTMFWARPAALAPLLDLGLTEAMMPDEPLPEDGTILHALERLIPFAVGKAGFRAAATYVPGSVR